MITLPGLEILDRLGEGASGEVFRARNPAGRECAVKVLSSGGLSRLERARFRREFQILADLDHPRIVKVLDFDDSVPCFTMELVQGQCLDDWLAALTPEGPLQEAHADGFLECLFHILQALSVLHGVGIIHRDLKPANIMITPGPAAKLMDFGLAHMAAEARLTRSGAVLGTPLYLAPELFSGADPDPRADLYSLGMVLYEACGGELPGLAATNLMGFLQQLLNWTPRDLCLCNPSVPEWMGRFVSRLLARSPSDRFPSALEAERELAGGIRRAALSPPPTAGAAGGILESALVGREAELARVEQLLSDLGSGREFLLLVSGEPGSGKSRLLQEVRRRALARGFQVQGVGCLEGDPTPYALFLPLMRQAVRELQREGRLGDVLAGSAPLLGRILPELGDSQGLAPVDPDPQKERSQLYEVIVRLLSSLRRSPCLFYFDDMQWADNASLDLLRYLSLRMQVGREQGLAPLATILLHRSDEVDERHPLQAVVESLARAQPLERICLGLLNAEQVARLAASILGGCVLPPELVGELAGTCGGNPLYAAELVRALVSDGVVACREGAWTLAEEPLSLQLQAAPSMALLLERRLGGLSELAGDLIAAAAILGRKFRYPVLAAMFEAGEEPLLGALDEVLRARLLCERPAEGRDMLAFYHDRFREVVLARIPGVRLQLWHRRAAAAYSSLQAPDDILAYHYLEGGDTQSARRHLHLAAESARRAYASRKAIGYYEQLLELGDAAMVEEALADLYGRTGEAQKSLEIYARLLEGERDASRRASLQRRRSWALRCLSRHNEAMDAILGALRSLGVALPRSRAGLVWSIGANLVASVGYLLRPPAPGDDPETARDEVEELYWTAFAFKPFLSSYPNHDLILKDLFCRHFLHAMRSRRTAQIARAQAQFAFGLTALRQPPLKIARQACSRAMELAPMITDRLARGQMMGPVAAALLQMGELESAANTLEQFFALLGEDEVYYRALAGVGYRPLVCGFQGRWEESARVALEGAHLAALGNDGFSEMVGLVRLAYARAVLGQPDQARLALAPVEGWLQKHEHPVLQQGDARARGVSDWYEGDLSGARQHFTLAHRLALLTGNGLFWECMCAFPFIEICAEAGDWPAAEGELRRWRRRVRGFPLLEVWRQRLQARLLSHQGRPEQAAQMLRLAAETAESMGARSEQGKGLGYLAELTGDPETRARACEILTQCQDRLALRMLKLE